MKYGEWFRVKGQDAKWFATSPINRQARCDKKWNHIVPPEAPRLLVDSGQGPIRKRGRGKQNEWLCAPCAKLWYDTEPPPLLEEMQEKLF